MKFVYMPKLSHALNANEIPITQLFSCCHSFFRVEYRWYWIISDTYLHITIIIWIKWSPMVIAVICTDNRKTRRYCHLSIFVDRIVKQMQIFSIDNSTTKSYLPASIWATIPIFLILLASVEKDLKKLHLLLRICWNLVRAGVSTIYLSLRCSSLPKSKWKWLCIYDYVNIGIQIP